MGLKILHSADWHLGAPFSSFSRQQRQLLQEQQQKLPQKITEVLRREECDLVLLAGDLFDGVPGRYWVDLLKKTLAEWKVPVCISPGNHDHCGPGSPWLEEVWPDNVHIFTGGLTSLVLPQLDCRVYGAGFRSMDSPPLLEGFRAEGEQTFCVAVLHGDPAVHRSACNPVTARQVTDSGLDYLALGHIHRAGAFRAGSTLCAWPGCPMGRGWDETGEKGVLVATLEETAHIQRVLLDTLRFYDLELEAGDDPAALLPGGSSDDFYRVTLRGWGKITPQQLQRSFAHLPNLSCRDFREEARDLWADVGEDTLRGVYFGLLQKQDARLAAEISHRLLSGREVDLP